MPLCQVLPTKLDDLVAIGELAVVESVARLEPSEAEDRDPRRFELRTVWIRVAINRS